MISPVESDQPVDDRRWYDGITRYQWTVLIIASLGWVFDVFEGQIFVASMNEAMKSLVDEGAPVATYNNIALGAFLFGGAVGGVGFGMLSDRIGRKKTMSLTILFYSAFTCLSALSMAWWHLAAFRLLVAIGVGGEWAVASTLVAEEFPQRARARVSGIFHASSVFGTYLAVAAGVWIIGNPMFKSEEHPELSWRLGFVVGALPALLILWIRRSLKEPESWERARAEASAGRSQSMGRISDLFRGDLLRPTLVGVSLAAVGLATFWGAHIFGRNLMRRDATPYFVPVPADQARVTVTAEERREWMQPVFDTAREDALEELQAQEQPVPDAAQQETLFDIVRQSYLASSWQAARAFDVEPDPQSGTNRVLAKFPPNPEEPSSRTTIVVADDLTEGGASFVRESMHAVRLRIDQKLKNWEMFGMLLATTGGGLGLLAFGPFCERVGRRPAFLVFHLGGLIVAVLTFQFAAGLGLLTIVLPIFGFFTLGMHAGYAIYFPELYPTRLRGTGGGFCFNAARMIVPPILILSGWVQDLDLPKEDAWSLLSLLYLVGAVVLVFAPETRGRELPE
ncbi:MAG: MFS transporter [Planctomycetota bacterium]|nr:MAG: MFS transporter [Planctomycetota bacterium]REJ93128.1 MAG: MFS transporter [Planctomycetota bacterium]REK30117.1 MAG: MFS transporter [Planctomycetota bacterium]REK37640.1 MAG: MFS transporter [Planctomycetota bacterium]